ncbi:MAG: hypothetical protein AB4426_34160 [Xenococcaceae cyanobacterium]
MDSRSHQTCGLDSRRSGGHEPIGTVNSICYAQELQSARHLLAVLYLCGFELQLEQKCIPLEWL